MLVRLIFSLAFLGVISLVRAQPEWELRKQQDGIQVFTSAWPNSGFEAFRGETLVDAPLSSIIAVLQDVARYDEWMPNARQTRLLDRQGDSRLLFYIRTKTPWPVRDRDGVYDCRFQRLSGGSVKIEIGCQADAQPEADGVVRIREAEGFWILQPQEKQVKVVYQVHAEPGGAIPAWLANLGLVGIPFVTLQELKSRVKMAAYRDQTFSFLNPERSSEK